MNRKNLNKCSQGASATWSLGEKLRMCRKEAGITQQELAEAADVEDRTIRTIEADGRYSAKMVGRVLDALNRLRERKGHSTARLVNQPGVMDLRQHEPSWLQFPQRQWLRMCHGPGALLTAEYAVVPFHGQRSLEERQHLVAWCSQDARLGIRIYKGAGGMGKTRLAVELCQTIARPEYGNWTTGFADHARFPRRAVPWTLLPELRRPLLVVVDYAGEDEKTWMVSRLLVHLHDCPAPKTRLLFLERDDLWLDRLHENRVAREILLGPLLTRSGEAEVHSLPPVAMTTAERADSFQQAAKAFGTKLGLKSLGPSGVDLTGRLYESVLYIHTRALLAMLGTEARGKTAILRHLLGREREHWRKRLESLGLSAGLLPVVEESILKISLVNGTPDRQDALRILESVASLKDQPQIVRRQIATLLRQCYPQGQTGIGPLQPDELKHFLMLQFA